MRCPHCSVAFVASEHEYQIANDPSGDWFILWKECANCERLIVTLGHTDWVRDSNMPPFNRGKKWLVWPRTASRGIDLADVPQHIATDYEEAFIVLDTSAKASAALSRRILQMLLREQGGVKKSDLEKEITEFIAQAGVPSDIAQSVDAVRHIGNFSAHPIKSTSTGEIVEVEPGEAEWNLETIEALFDHFFTKPKKLEERREALNKKLGDAGKPALK